MRYNSMRDTDVIQHIKDLCAERHWSYYRLAQEAGIPYSTISNMIHRTNIPTIPTLQKMCDGFGMTLSDFFMDTVSEVHLTGPQQEVLELYAKLSVDDKKLFMTYGRGLAKIL